jgi:hypothetical protein
MNYPDHIVWEIDDGTEIKVYFEYDLGEAQWFDARAGVGSPGYPPSVEITEVDFGRGREGVGVYPQLNLDAIHVRIVDTLAAVDETNDAEYVEHLVTKHEEMSRFEDH